MKYTVEYVQGLNYEKLSAKKIVWHSWQKWLEIVKRHKAGETDVLSNYERDCSCCCASQAIDVDCYIKKTIPCPLDAGASCCDGLFDDYCGNPSAATASAVADFIESKWKEMK